jgi:hypothetical protein
VNVSYEAKMPQMLHIAFFVASIVFTLRARVGLLGHYLQAKIAEMPSHLPSPLAV